MSTLINDGGPAFPHFKTNEQGKTELCPQGGMTLRDWFAGQALQGVLASLQIPHQWDEIAQSAYRGADAMLAARKEASK